MPVYRPLQVVSFLQWFEGGKISYLRTSANRKQLLSLPGSFLPGAPCTREIVLEKEGIDRMRGSFFWPVLAGNAPSPKGEPDCRLGSFIPEQAIMAGGNRQSTQ